MSRPATREAYAALEAVRRRVLRQRWRTAENRVEAAWLEAELYAYESALLDGKPLPDLDAVEVEGRFPGGER